MAYVIRVSTTGGQSYSVGFYGPDGRWSPESQYFGEGAKDYAAARCNYLNGGTYDEDVKNVVKRFGRLEDRLTILVVIIAVWAVFTVAL